MVDFGPFFNANQETGNTKLFNLFFKYFFRRSKHQVYYQLTHFFSSLILKMR